MSDVLLVFVRADEARAEALAEMFAAAGFSISDNPFDEEEARRTRAVVVILSHAALRSSAFRAAAELAMSHDKAIFASFVGAPAAEALAPRVFDLCGWDGDPDHALVDPLFFAVDRMVITAHAREREADKADEVEPVLIAERAEQAEEAEEAAIVPFTPAPAPRAEPHPRAPADVVTMPLVRLRPPSGRAGAVLSLAFIALVSAAALTASFAFVGGAPAQHAIAAARAADEGAPLPPPPLPEAVRFAEVAEPAPAPDIAPAPPAAEIEAAYEAPTPEPWMSWAPVVADPKLVALALEATEAPAPLVGAVEEVVEVRVKGEVSV